MDIDGITAHEIYHGPLETCDICHEHKPVCCDDGPGGDYTYCPDCCPHDHGPQPEGRVYYPEG